MAHFLSTHLPPPRQLLARHSADTSSMPKPILNRKRIKIAASVKPPPGESFYASESSDEELELLMRSEAVTNHLQKVELNLSKDRAMATTNESDDSDFEILSPDK
jgi:hypothetical protein